MRSEKMSSPDPRKAFESWKKELDSKAADATVNERMFKLAQEIEELKEKIPLGNPKEFDAARARAEEILKKVNNHNFSREDERAARDFIEHLVHLINESR